MGQDEVQLQVMSEVQSGLSSPTRRSSVVCCRGASKLWAVEQKCMQVLQRLQSCTLLLHRGRSQVLIAGRHICIVCMIGNTQQMSTLAGTPTLCQAGTHPHQSIVAAAPVKQRHTLGLRQNTARSLQTLMLPQGCHTCVHHVVTVFQNSATTLSQQTKHRKKPLPQKACWPCVSSRLPVRLASGVPTGGLLLEAVAAGEADG